MRVGIDMPVQRNKETKRLVLEKHLDLTLIFTVHQHSDRPSYKVHRRFKKFAVDTYTAVIVDLPDELDPEKVV